MLSISCTYILTAALLLPSILATAASQFHLNTIKDVSSCWNECHVRITDTILTPDNKNNSAVFISLNCAYDTYLQYQSLCLPEVCESAPDVAYAVEYGHEFCLRAGVDAKIVLPEDYLNGTAREYFNSAAYLASSASATTMLRSSGAVVVALSAALGLVLA
ncbi:hypothetical protein P7C73_g2112, partial [Tremellales sp. Uapishka_1]